MFCLSVFWTNGLISQVINERAEIIIEFHFDENTFPKKWQKNRINGKAMPLDSLEMERSRQIISKALDKYPDEFLKINLKKIVVLKSMEFFGQSYGGTNSKGTVYVANDGVNNGYTDYFIEKSFHHEFSSVLIKSRSNKFKKRHWKKLNSIKYGKGGMKAIESSNISSNFDGYYNTNGFLYEYAQSSLENDFNSFAENLFLPDKSYYKVVSSNSILFTKHQQIIRFYNSLNKVFTEDYFKGFNKW